MIRRFIKNVLGKVGKRRVRNEPVILTRSAHGIQREAIHECALKICENLSSAGFKAFVVGGAVRDLLLGKKPKDFDVATDATPEQIRRLFKRSRIIGRRFRIVHVMCGRDTIEVTTFRAAGDVDGNERRTDETGRILEDNVFGTQSEDAARRDFTVNALYYDPLREEIWDYHDGVNDCRHKILRMIGDPAARYREDPVRMLRAVRLAAKLDFHIDPATRKPVAELASLLGNIPRARLFDETIKLLMSGHALRGIHQLRDAGLHHSMLPLLDTVFDDPHGSRFIEASLKNTDQRIQADKPASPAFLFACLLWPQVVERWKAIERAGESPSPALFAAMNEVLDAQREQLTIPRRFAGMVKEVWALQPRFEQRSGTHPFRLLAHPRFRAGYDFLCLRAEAGEVAQELADWWTNFQNVDDASRKAMLLKDSNPKAKRRRRRRKLPGIGLSVSPTENATPAS